MGTVRDSHKRAIVSTTIARGGDTFASGLISRAGHGELHSRVAFAVALSGCSFTDVFFRRTLAELSQLSFPGATRNGSPRSPARHPRRSPRRFRKQFANRRVIMGRLGHRCLCTVECSVFVYVSLTHSQTRQCSGSRCVTKSRDEEAGTGGHRVSQIYL